MLTVAQESILLQLLTLCLGCNSPASLAVRATCDGANVSRQVASHANVQSLFQGITVAPSGLFLSEYMMPEDSR